MNPESPTPSAFIRRASADSVGSASGERSLPSDMMDRGARRLRALALVYAFVFFMQTFVGSFLDPNVNEFESFHDWGISTLSIVVALLVAWMTTRKSLSHTTIVYGGLVFQVVGSYGIAMAQYWGLYENLDYEFAHLEAFGLSWVAVWMLLFSIVVPTRPSRAFVAAVGSASSVPVIFSLSMKYGGTSIVLTPSQFVTGLILPYVLIILMTHVGARAIYRLGREVAKAREMGSYHLVERLGVGGMGEVWRAEHRMLARPAAIKLIRPEVLGKGSRDSHATVLRRFEQEAQATASMRSPHTIVLYDFGVTNEGTFHYVMELLDGFDLETLVERFGPVPPERAIHFLRQACHSLAEAHASGLIHRDIKPANVYVCRYGREVDFVKVLDFGLVKSQGVADRSSQVKLTADNVIGGTPAYMSPEQALGDQALDGRSDIYALGCLGYWLVTGQLVFEGETRLRTIVMHTQDVPTPPSQRTELPIPADFEEIILRCLAKDPADRPQTADQLARELAACCSASEWTAERAHEWWERHHPESSERPVFAKNT
ncbi:MAG: serine/threonine-protein kinase [Gemmatimonadales bacterium]